MSVLTESHRDSVRRVLAGEEPGLRGASLPGAPHWLGQCRAVSAESCSRPGRHAVPRLEGRREVAGYALTTFCR